jgi:trehalose-phosphatase
MEYLLVKKEEIDRIRNADKILLILDFDGTLSPIASHPENAVLPVGTGKLLEDLRNNGTIIAVVSGRGLEDVTARVGVQGIIYVGNHGMEIQGISPLFGDLTDKKGIIERISREGERTLAGLHGIILEDKQLSLSIHYRMAEPETVEELMERFARMIAPYEDNLRITLGRKVIEVRPKGVPDKGDIALHLAGLFPSFTPIYIGDDATDEDAFEALQEKDAITVLVSPKGRKSRARYFLKDPEDVMRLLSIIREKGK